MKGLMIVIVVAGTIAVAAGQNMTQTSCSQQDIDELKRLITEVNECDPCEVEEPEDCKCCALYRSAVALRELCFENGNKRDVNILSNNNFNLKDVCTKALIKSDSSSGSAMTAGITMMAVTFIAATTF